MRGRCQECGSYTPSIAADGYYFLCARHEGVTRNAGAVPDILSERELQVACYIADGYRNAEIADELNLSVGYINNVASRVMKNLNVPNRTRVAAVLRRWNLP